MFTHQGEGRTAKHNLQIASALSFVAGIVNVTGFLYFAQLTTNITGHFTLIFRDLANFEFLKGALYLVYMASFLLGSFSSSVLIEKLKANKKFNVFVLPTVIECIILGSIALVSNIMEIKQPEIIVSLLLFAMGLQNSFVTKISDAVVRTTHLTGLFTDLGIELSQLFFPKSYPNRSKLKQTITLRLYIISFFFLGGLIGGYFYISIGLKLNTLFLAVITLIISLFYDDIKYGLLLAKRKIKQTAKPKM